MKPSHIAATMLVLMILAACAPAALSTAAPSQPAQVVTPTQGGNSTQAPLPSTGLQADETRQVTAVVQGLGGKLQLVSLLSPTAAADIQAQYKDYVSSDLLTQWAADPSMAPGRLTSSPWPDHIDIASMAKDPTGAILVKGIIVEVTSVEANTGGAAATIPVEITLQKNAQGSWQITGWKQGR